MLVAAAKIVDEYISLRPISGPHGALVLVLLDQFFLYNLPILLQNTWASEAIMMVLVGQARSIRHFNATLAERVKQLIGRLRAWLNSMSILRADHEASVKKSTAEI